QTCALPIFMTSFQPLSLWFMAHSWLGDQCQNRNSESLVRRYQSHSTSVHSLVMASLICVSFLSVPSKNCRAVSNPCIRNEVSTRSPPLSTGPKNGTVFPVVPSTKCEKAP